MCPVSRLKISIHALRGEGDHSFDFHFRRFCCISIHALRGEGDLRSFEVSTMPLRISIHALRGEGDEEIYKLVMWVLKFQSTPSVGRATT